MSFREPITVRGQLDVISIFVIIVAMMILAFQTIGFGFGKSPIGVIGIVLFVLGMTMFFLMNLVVKPFWLDAKTARLVDPDLSSIEVFSTATAGIVAFIMILLVNVAITNYFPSQLASKTITATTNAVNFAVVEEVFFRLGLQVLLMYLGTASVGIGINAFFGTVYHGYRYGANPEFLAIVFFAWIIIGYAFYAAKGRLTATLIPHVLVNLVSTPPPGFENVNLGGFQGATLPF